MNDTDTSCWKWRWMFKRVIPLEMQIGLLAGSHVAMSLLKSLIICLKEFEEEENVAVFRWSDEKEQYHHTPTSSTRTYQVLPSSQTQTQTQTDTEQLTDENSTTTHPYSTTTATVHSSGSSGSRDCDGPSSSHSSSVDVNNNDVQYESRYMDYVHLWGGAIILGVVMLAGWCEPCDSTLSGWFPLFRKEWKNGWKMNGWTLTYDPFVRFRFFNVYVRFFFMQMFWNQIISSINFLFSFYLGWGEGLMKLVRQKFHWRWKESSRLLNGV